MPRILLPALLLPALLLLAACDTMAPATFESEYVVEAYLVADEGLPQIRLSRTAPLEATYDFEAVAVRDARVEVRLLAPDGAVEKVYRYEMNPMKAGVYLPVGAAAVRPKRTYALDVTFSGNDDRVTARTTVPAAISLGEVNADTVVYRSGEQYVLRVRRSQDAARQSYFIFTSEALDVRVEQLTPFARSRYDQGDRTLEDLRRGASPILNESNYDVIDETIVAVRFPWLGVVFYGPNRITASAIDDNLYDFLRTQNAQRGGTTLSAGEVPNILEHVDGGTGIFGSFARATFDVYIAR